MPRLIWSQAALRDVSRLHAFLASRNREAVKRAVGAIRQGVRLLAEHAAVGRPVPDMPTEFREWPIAFGSGGYVALYRHHDKDVIILAVRHGREAEYP
jgi:plasmid stabilization system protein ParE